ncbi:MAG: hypothetical protein M1407_04120 [Deltaproteobacteria bacterium]|nr:hypothetical protein [Deltaproteobacteria bacterium]
MTENTELPTSIKPELTSDVTGRAEFQTVKESVDLLKFIIYGIIIVLFLGFASLFIAVTSMLVNSWEGKAENYQILINKVNNIDNKINSSNKIIKRYFLKRSNGKSPLSGVSENRSTGSKKY